MATINQNVNLGVNDLWALAYKDFKPYQDRLRSTNVREFTRDTTLDNKTETFKKDNSVTTEEFIQDKILGS